MKRILFVDDESKVLDGMRRMLHADRQRWDLQFAVGGEAALQACEAGGFDVVISDMRMPGMDGATLLGHIRDRFPSTARIVLSGYSDGGLSTRAVPVAHRFLTKPCNGVDLRAMIEKVCILQDLLATAELRRIIGSIGELPSLSSTYTSLLQALRDDNSSIHTVAQIIAHDMGMSAKVLQLVNSAFFGLAQTVTTVQSAASFLGLETIKNLALASEAFRMFVPDARIPQSVCESIQRHTQISCHYRRASARPETSRRLRCIRTSARYRKTRAGEQNARHILFRGRPGQRTRVPAVRSRKGVTGNFPRRDRRLSSRIVGDADPGRGGDRPSPPSHSYTSLGSG
jgi:YesN/AraC family two-component response regulator